MLHQMASILLRQLRCATPVNCKQIYSCCNVEMQPFDSRRIARRTCQRGWYCRKSQYVSRITSMRTAMSSPSPGVAEAVALRVDVEVAEIVCKGAAAIWTMFFMRRLPRDACASSDGTRKKIRHGKWAAFRLPARVPKR